MTNQHKQPGGARQLLARASGLCPFRTTRRSDPHSPSHSAAAVPIHLPDQETTVTAESRTEGAAPHQPGRWPAQLDQMRADRQQRERENRPLILHSQFRDAVATILADQPSPRCIRTTAHRLIAEITFMSGDAIKTLNDRQGGDQ